MNFFLTKFSYSAQWVEGIAQSIQRLATGQTVRGLDLGGGHDFSDLSGSAPPPGPPSLLYKGYRVFFSREHSGPFVAFTTHSFLALG